MQSRLCLLAAFVLVHTADSFTVMSVNSKADLKPKFLGDTAQTPLRRFNSICRRKALELAVGLPLSTVLLPDAAPAAAPPVPSMWGVTLPVKVDEAFSDSSDGTKYKELYSGTGKTPSQSDAVKVLLSTFSVQGATLGPREIVEKFDLSKDPLRPGLKSALLSMKMGAQRVLVLPPDSFTQEPAVVFVKLLAITGHICSSDEEERRKGNVLDFHTCGEVTESTERVRLFCEKTQCVEQSYLDVQSRRARN